MNAKEYLESKGVFGLDTKKRYNEVIEWMEGYAQERVKNCSIPAVMGELTCDGCDCHPNTIYTTSKGRFCERCKPAS